MSLIALLILATAGCAAPIARQYYTACIEAGHNAGECKMRAIEVNQRAWAGFSNSMGQASASFQQAGQMAEPTIHTHTRCTEVGSAGFGAVNCQSVSH